MRALRRQPSFGLRLRALRRRSGLSQTDLAGDVLSPSAVSLLEAGRREPSWGTIETLAARLGCTPAALADGVGRLVVTDGSRLVGLGELALRDGNQEVAARHFEEALAGGVLDPWRAMRARIGLAEVAEAEGRGEEAIALLEGLIADFADQRAAVPLAVSEVLARIQRGSGQLRECRSTVRAALDRIAWLGLGGLDEYVRLGIVVVGALADGGDLVTAATEARKLLEGVTQAPADRADAYRRAADRAAAQGCDLEALYFTERAVRIRREDDGMNSHAALRMTLAWLLLRQEQPDAGVAQSLLFEARRELEHLGDLNTLVCCETQLSQVALVRHQPAEAARWAETALERRGPGIGGVERIHARMALGESRFMAGDGPGAVACYTEAAEALAQFDDSRMTAAIWNELGRLFHEAGEADEALQAYNRVLTSSR